MASLLFFLSIFLYAVYLFLLVFLVTSFLVVTVQPCMEWIPMKIKMKLKFNFKVKSKFKFNFHSCIKEILYLKWKLKTFKGLQQGKPLWLQSLKIYIPTFAQTNGVSWRSANFRLKIHSCKRMWHNKYWYSINHTNKFPQQKSMI